MQSTINSTHKIKATTEQIHTMMDYYQGYLEYGTSDYIHARAKLANATITFYKTNVVLFQGINATNEYNKWAQKFGLNISNEPAREATNYENLIAIGSDEVGTGDYFGPIVVCATYTDHEAATKLRHLGVKDSKLLTDKQMIPLALEIAAIVPYSIIYLDPYKLNSLSSKYDNLNFIKAYLHNKAINSILKKIGNVKYDAILIDEFTPKEKYLKYIENQSNVVSNITTVVHGEKEHIGIAAASILARAAFLRELKKLSIEYKMELLKGAGHEVDRSAISFVRSYGFKELFKVAKIKFANSERIIKFFENNPLPKSKELGLIEIKQKLKVL
ncbi:MAG: ribonuclease HIII [Bacilli bacterium]